MTKTRRRQVLITLGTGAVAAVAGCIGDSDDAAGDDGLFGSDDDDSSIDDDPAETDDDQVADGTDDDTDGGGEESLGDSDGEFDRDVWEPMEFAFEGRYEWELFVEGEDGFLVWDVVDIDGDEITVETEFVLGEVEFEQTIASTQQDMENELIMTPAGVVFTWTTFSPMMGGLIGEEFTVGDEWSYTTPEGSISYAVTDLDTTNYPVDCYVVEMYEDDQLLHEGCVSPDHGMTVYTAWYDEGELEFEIELVSFDRH